MKKIIIVFFIIPFLFASCKPKQENTEHQTDKPFEKKKPSLMGAWKMDINPASKNTNSNDDFFNNDEDMDPIKHKAALWAFYPDGNFTSIDGKINFLHGTWKFVNNKKSISINNGINEETYNIKVIVGKYKLVLELTSLNNDKVKKFERHAEMCKDFTLDPFYYANNMWRIKPTSSENDLQIKNRLSGYIKHVSFILKSAQENDQSSASFEFSEGIIKIYDGGIGTNDDKTIPNYWKEAYYNNNELNNAVTLFKKNLQNASKNIEGTGNWYIDDYNILATVYAKMNTEKLPVLNWEKEKETDEE